MTGTLNGPQITENLLLLGGFVAKVPTSMALLSRLLPYGTNHWATIIAAVMTLLFEIMNDTIDLDDTFHIFVDIAALFFIICSAWR
ncbi:MAG: DUF6326 family protein [Pseudomonadota bacterium]